MHLKYRPRTLDQLFGNDELKRVIPTLNLHRPILIEGFFGSGKTSLAYILAGMFGADEYNIKDINCVHFSKIDDMRSELDSLTKSSIFGKKRVLILDEIHELSEKSLKVILKPLEDEKLLKDVLIIGCTTEVGSISKILLSRFTILRVRPLTVTESKQLLDYVCSKEGIRLDKAFKQLLVEKAEGVARILLKNIALVRGAASIEEAKYLLELSFLDDMDSDVLTLYKALQVADWGVIRGMLSTLLKQKSPNMVKVGLQNLIGGRLLSDYMKEVEGDRLISLYSILDGAYKIPEKASLIVALHKFMKGR